MGKHVAPVEPKQTGRRRAENPVDPANTGQIARTGRRRVAQVVVATGAMALVTASASPAAAPAEVRHVSAKDPQTEQVPIVASAGKHVAFDRVDVRTEPAPPPPIVQTPPEAEQNNVQEKPPVAKLVPKKPVIVAPPKPAPAPAPKPAPVTPPVVVAPPAATGAGAAIAAAALAQLGRRQDCTRLVTNSLAAVGIAHHGWPISYTALGTRVTDPLPGDLIYYVNGGMGLAHIAVYIGNGMAVHGGWNGNQTVTFKANVGSGPIYIRVRA